MPIRNPLHLFLSAALLAGCVETEASVDTSSEALSAYNGVSLNGVRLNGVSLNGVRLNGVRLNGVRLNGVSLNGVSLNGVSLNGSQLGGFDGSTPLAADDLVGTSWEGSLSSGESLSLRIEDVSTGTGANSDITMYRIVYDTSEGWTDLCPTTSYGPPAAIAVPGTWNYDEGVPGGGSYDPDSGQFTFACRGVAIAKCVEMGYKPWNGLSDYLATCTRTLRGDYCGDGRPYTADGTTINIYDTASVQTDTEGWTFEAEWSPDGAECINAPAYTRFFQAAHTTPTCLDALRAKQCPAGSVSKIRTELPPVQ